MTGRPLPPADRTAMFDLCQQANELRRQNELDAALQVAEQAFDGAKQLSDPELVGECMLTLADIHHDREDYLRAEALYRQAFVTFQEAGVERGQGEAQLGLGIVYLDRGELEEAQQSLLHALAYISHLNNRIREPLKVANAPKM